jgi:hypothetical protein
MRGSPPSRLLPAKIPLSPVPGESVKLCVEKQIVLDVVYPARSGVYVLGASVFEVGRDVVPVNRLVDVKENAKEAEAIVSLVLKHRYVNFVWVLTRCKKQGSVLTSERQRICSKPTKMLSSQIL